MSSWTANDIPDQSGRTVIVTGANSGLGFVTSRELARHGAHVIMTARDPTKGRVALDKILATRPRGSAELRLLDLADLDAVKEFAKRLLADGTPVDIRSPPRRGWR